MLTFEPCGTLTPVPLDGVGQTHSFVLTGGREARVTLCTDGDVRLLCQTKIKFRGLIKLHLLWDIDFNYFFHHKATRYSF